MRYKVVVRKDNSFTYFLSINFFSRELYDAPAAPVASTHNVLAERLQRVHDTVYLLYQKTKEKNWDMDRH